MTGLWPVVVHIARRYRRRGEPIADLQQIGAVGLLGALERFDPDCGIDFLAFAVPTITGEICRHFRDRSWSMRVPQRPARHAHRPHSIDEVISGEGAQPARGDLLGAADTALIAAGYRHDLRRALAALPERERTILVLRFFGDLTQTPDRRAGRRVADARVPAAEPDPRRAARPDRRPRSRRRTLSRGRG